MLMSSGAFSPSPAADFVPSMMFNTLFRYPLLPGSESFPSSSLNPITGVLLRLFTFFDSFFDSVHKLLFFSSSLSAESPLNATWKSFAILPSISVTPICSVTSASMVSKPSSAAVASKEAVLSSSLRGEASPGVFRTLSAISARRGGWGRRLLEEEETAEEGRGRSSTLGLSLSAAVVCSMMSQ